VVVVLVDVVLGGAFRGVVEVGGDARTVDRGADVGTAAGRAPAATETVDGGGAVGRVASGAERAALQPASEASTSSAPTDATALRRGLRCTPP